jgi:hypothetical protein
MHILIWLKDSLSPQEIRNLIIDKTSDFQQQMIQYLESVHKGEFFNGQLANISRSVAESEINEYNYTDPTKNMPTPPPSQCNTHTCKGCVDCIDCINDDTWCTKFRQTVDDIIL